MSILRGPYIWETTDGGVTWIRVTDTLVASLYAYYDVYHVGRPTGNTIGLGPGPIFFPTLSNRYISNPTPPGSTAQGGSYEPILAMGVIMRSSDTGKTWLATGTYTPPMGTEHYYPSPVGVLSSKIVLGKDPDGRLLISGDGGSTYPRLAMDSVFAHDVWGVSIDSLSWAKRSVSGYSFDCSDASHWTIVPKDLGTTDSTERIQPGMHTLVTNDLGFHWQLSVQRIPGTDTTGRFDGTLQYVKATPMVYYFTGPRQYLEGEAYPCYGCEPNPTRTDSDLITHAVYGINWLYSTDYGLHWAPNRTFAVLRRGFEVVGDQDIWITRRSASAPSILSPAFIISHTTDNGLSWSEDSLSLRDPEQQPVDGRIVTFSDPRHGWIAATAGDPNNGGRHVYIFRSTETAGVDDANTSREDFMHRVFQIYPNPSSEQVHLQIIPPRRITAISFYNLFGVALHPSYSLDGSTATVEVHSLSPGVYLTRVTYVYDDYVGTYSLPLMVVH